MWRSPCPSIYLSWRICVIRLLTLSICAVLSGCATIYAKDPLLKPVDVKTTDVEGVSIDVAYDLRSELGVDSFGIGAEVDKDEARKEVERRAEVLKLLKGYGFNVEAEKPNYVLQIVEDGTVSETDSVLMLMLSSFTATIVPFTETSTHDFHYALKKEGSPVAQLDTRAQTKRLGGLLAIPLMPINMTGAVTEGARDDAHRGVISMWIDQGAFE